MFNFDSSTLFLDCRLVPQEEANLEPGEDETYRDGQERQEKSEDTDTGTDEIDISIAKTAINNVVALLHRLMVSPVEVDGYQEEEERDQPAERWKLRIRHGRIENGEGRIR